MSHPEKHPFGDFVPPKSKYLLLGSFAAKPKPGYEWFYANGRNQFWPIMEEVYERKLKTKKAQQQLFIALQMALSDVILECQRLNNSNLDTNLTNIEVNNAITNTPQIYTNAIYFKSWLETILNSSRQS